MSDTLASHDPNAPHPPGCACPACRPDLAPGDVVLAAVAPRHGRRGRAEPTPCVVLDVEEAEGGRRALLARGAPARGRPARRGDLYATAADLCDAGLTGPHLFVAGRPTVVPLGREGADAGPRPVVLGPLGGSARDRLGALRRRRRAEPGTQGGTPAAALPVRASRPGAAAPAPS